MARTTGVPNRAKHEPRCYREHALKHHTQALVVVTAVAVAVITLSIIIPLVMLVSAEVMLMAFLPRCGWFRRGVDEELEALAVAEAVEARASLVARISEGHRRELEELERLAARIAERSTRAEEDGNHRVDDDWLGLGRLLSAYVELAIAHRTTTESLAATDRGYNGPAHDIVALEALRATASESTQPWIERRLQIARGRVIATDRAREERAKLTHGLATIAELIRWTHDECVACHGELLGSVLVDSEAACASNGRTLREVVTLCAELQSIDPKVFAVRPS